MVEGGGCPAGKRHRQLRRSGGASLGGGIGPAGRRCAGGGRLLSCPRAGGDSETDCQKPADAAGLQRKRSADVARHRPCPDPGTKGRAASFVSPVRKRGRDSKVDKVDRSEEHTSELQSLMRSSSAVFCLK